MYESYNYQENQNNQTSEADRQAEMRARLLAEKKAKKKARRKKVTAIVLGALLFGVVAGGTTVGVSVLGKYLSAKVIPGITKEADVKDNDSEKEDTDNGVEKEKDEKTDAVKLNVADSSSKTKTASASTSSGELTIPEVAQNTMPSIVSITNKSVQEVRMMFSNRTQLYENESRGSGIIVGQNDEELLVLTNNHVVEGAETITVAFIDDEVCEAVVKGTDSENDLAVIAIKLDDIKDSTLDEIKIAVIGNSDDLVIGEQVVAIGNALGYGQSVTTGIVSALNRDGGFQDYVEGLIQTDAAINPGNSGGALLNMRGEVIGINSAKLASDKIEGMGYAIPMATALPIVENLMNRKTREAVSAEEAGYLGISGVTVTEENSKSLGIPQGAGISEVVEGAAADKAGLKKGDVIVKFDGLPISSFAELKKQIAYYKAGEEIEVVVARANDGEYKEMTIEITLDKWPEDALQSSGDKQTDKSEDSSDENKDNDENGENNQEEMIPENGYYSIEDLFNFFNHY